MRCVVFFFFFFLSEVFASSCPAKGRCSACERFVEGFYAQCAKAKKASNRGEVYKERLEAIYEAHAPEKVGGVAALLKRAKGGKEHELYARVCQKYGVDEEAAPAEDRMASVKAALTETVDALDSQQWAQSVDAAERVTFVDFQQAMAGGSITGSISMGPDVTQTMKACYEEFVKEREAYLVEAMAAVTRPYDSKLHTTFCESIHACDPDGVFEL